MSCTQCMSAVFETDITTTCSVINRGFAPGNICHPVQYFLQTANPTSSYRPAFSLIRPAQLKLRPSRALHPCRTPRRAARCPAARSAPQLPARSCRPGSWHPGSHRCSHTTTQIHVLATGGATSKAQSLLHCVNHSRLHTETPAFHKEASTLQQRRGKGAHCFNNMRTASAWP